MCAIQQHLGARRIVKRNVAKTVGFRIVYPLQNRRQTISIRSNVDNLKPWILFGNLLWPVSHCC